MEAVSRIGEYVQRTEGGEDLLSAFIDDPNNKGNYKFVLIVILNDKNGEYSFNRVVFDEFSDYKKYLYKKGPANGTDITPTCKIAGNLRKTFQNRFLRWFQSYDSYSISIEEKEILRKMNVAIRDQTEKILADLEEKFSQKKSNDNAIITLGIERDGEISYPGDQQVFKNILLKKGCEIFFEKYGYESKGKNALCSICKQKKDEVYGFAIPWTFHTFDKPGFIAGGFNIIESWKNTPVCLSCAIRLEVGKKYIEQNLDFGFYGFRYLLVPKLTLAGNKKEVLEEVLDILGKKDEKRKIKINREIKNRITADENEIFEFVQDQKDFFSNSLLFYKKEQSSYRILLLIDGILPSRLKALFKAKENIDERFKISCVFG